jgi:3-oxoadipate enol-lactonase
VQYQSADAELFYTGMGSGADVVLLHPMPVHHAFWLPVAEILAQRYRVTLLDLRGHGRSQAGAGPVTIERLGEDVIRLLDILEIRKALFAGCSIGGYTLYELWRQIPDRVQGLAFCSSKPQADTAVNRAKRQQSIQDINTRGTDQFFRTMSETLIGQSTRRRNPSKVDEALAMMRRVTPEAMVAILQGLAMRPDSVATARTITAPTCVIAAEENGGSTPDDMRLLAESIRNGGSQSEYHLIHEAGHYAPWEKPEEVGSILRRFFDSVVG